MKEDLERLQSLGICERGIEFVKEKGSIERAWEECDRVYWLLRYAKKIGVDDCFTISFTDIEGSISTIDLSFDEGTELANQINGFIRDRKKYKEPAF